MDGQRNFADEPEHRWFPDRGHAEPDWQNADDDRYRAEGYGAGEGRGGTAGESRYGGRDAEDERFRDPLGAQSGAGSRYGESGSYRGDADSGYGGGRPDAGLPPQGGPPVTSAAPLGDQVGRADDRSMGASTGSMPPVGGPDGPLFGTETMEHPALRRPPAPGVSGGGDGVYRTRRPMVTVLIVLLTVLFEIPAMRLLLAGSLADTVSASGVIAGTLMVIGLPILGVGLNGLASSAVPAGDAARFWLRPPGAYLVVAFALLAAAGLAAA